MHFQTKLLSSVERIASVLRQYYVRVNGALSASRSWMMKKTTSEHGSGLNTGRVRSDPDCHFR
jgi:hypothetical protein